MRLRGASFVLCLSCGGALDRADAGSGDAAGTLDAPSPSTTDSAAPTAACPARVPADGDPCSAQRSCEYGDSAKLNCNVIATCGYVGCGNDFVWSVTPPDRVACAQTSVPGCPPSYAEAVLGSCDQHNRGHCDYAEGACHCFNPGPWTCNDTPSACPTSRPRLGSSCAIPPKVLCPVPTVEQPAYVCRLFAIECVDGLWQPTFDCPIIGAPNPC